MKTLTGIILIFAIGAQIVTEAASIPIPIPSNPIEPLLSRAKRDLFKIITEDDLPHINLLRKVLTKTSGIATPDLKWDSQMVAKAEKVSTDCTNEEQGADFRFLRSGADNNAHIVDSMFYAISLNADIHEKVPDLTKEQREALEKIGKELRENPHKFSLQLYEVFNPYQTLIGCAQNPCQGTIPDIWMSGLNFEGNKFSYSQVCALGMSSKIPANIVQMIHNHTITIPDT